jgi:hypothetical protein
MGCLPDRGTNEASVETPRGTRQVPALVSYLQLHNLRQLGLGRSEHPWHRQGLVHLSGSGALETSSWFFQIEESGPCPPSGTRYRLGHSLQVRSSRCPGVLSIEVHDLPNNR